MAFLLSIVCVRSSHFKYGDRLVNALKQHCIIFNIYHAKSFLNFISIYTFGTKKFNYRTNLTIGQYCISLRYLSNFVNQTQVIQLYWNFYHRWLKAHHHSHTLMNMLVVPGVEEKNEYFYFMYDPHTLLQFIFVWCDQFSVAFHNLGCIFSVLSLNSCFRNFKLSLICILSSVEFVMDLNSKINAYG